MKRCIALLLACLMLATCLSACGKTQEPEPEKTPTAQTPAEPTQEAPAAEATAATDAE